MHKLPVKARGRRPDYFEDPAVDRLMSITLALAGEVAVLRDRVDSIERLAEAGEPITRATIDAYRPDPAAAADREAWRATFLDVVLRAVHQDGEALMADRAGEAAEDAIHAVAMPA